MSQGSDDGYGRRHDIPSIHRCQTVFSNILFWPLSATRSLCTSSAYRFEVVDDPCRPWQGFAADLMDLAEVLMRRVEQNVVSLRQNGCRYFYPHRRSLAYPPIAEDLY